MKPTLTTTQAAYLCGVDPRSFTRWAREHGVTPLRRQRIGRSTVTVWATSALLNATRSSTNAA